MNGVVPFCVEIWYSVLCKDKLVNWTKPTVLDLIKIHPPDSFSSLVYTSYSPAFSGCLKPQSPFIDNWTEFLTLMVCMSLPIQTKWSPRTRSASGHATPEGSSVRLETTRSVCLTVENWTGNCLFQEKSTLPRKPLLQSLVLFSHQFFRWTVSQAVVRRPVPLNSLLYTAPVPLNITYLIFLKSLHLIYFAMYFFLTLCI